MHQIPFLAVGLIVAFALVSVWVVGVNVTRGVDEAGLKDDGTADVSADGKTVVVAGRTYGLRRTGGAVTAPHWVVSLPVDSPHAFSVHRESGMSELVEHLGLLTEVDLGDARYDSEFQIRSKDAGWAKGFFSDAENRRLVQALFGLDASAVSLGGGTVAAYFKEKEVLGDGAQALSELAARLPARP
jgi:hypothetical protein